MTTFQELSLKLGTLENETIPNKTTWEAEEETPTYTSLEFIADSDGFQEVLCLRNESY